MEKFKYKTIICLIIVLSFLMLTFKLKENPQGVYVDEATTGYNAYSILKTGSDEYGKEFPIAFKFFGSYSPPLYVYLTTIPIYFWDLNEFSVRIVSAILGSLMVLIIYFFLIKSDWFDKKMIPLILLVFTVTPWNFFFARTGYEIYLGFFIFSIGALLTWLGLEKKFLLTLGIVTLSLSTYGSHSQIYASPLFLILFLIIFNRQIQKKYLGLGLLLGVLIQIPHLFLLNTQAFLNKSDLFYLDEILTNSTQIILPRVISVPLSFLFSFFARFSTYFSPANLFFNPDPDPQRSMPEISVFYNWMVMPFFVGLLVLAGKARDKFSNLVIILCIAQAIPASLTKDPFSTQRALGLLLPLFIIIAIGIQSIAKKLGYKTFLLLYTVVFGLSSLMLWRSYFVLLPSERAVNWSLGYKELSRKILENPGTNFVIDQSKGKPSYTELAFFLKIDPALVQSQSNTESNEYYNDPTFKSEKIIANADNRKMVWEEDIYKEQILVGDELLVSDTQAKEHFLTEVFVIKDPRGYTLFKGYKTDPKKKCEATNYNSVLCRR